MHLWGFPFGLLYPPSGSSYMIMTGLRFCIWVDESCFGWRFSGTAANHPEWSFHFLLDNIQREEIAMNFSHVIRHIFGLVNQNTKWASSFNKEPHLCRLVPLSFCFFCVPSLKQSCIVILNRVCSRAPRVRYTEVIPTCTGLPGLLGQCGALLKGTDR